MNTKEVIDKAEEALLHTYNRVQVVFDHGDGVRLYDTEGRSYLDFGSGIGVMGLGYHYPGYDEALKAQIDKLTHTSNLFYTVPGAEAAEAVKKATGMDRVFFTNSGTEAIEGALKLAKKFANQQNKGPEHTIIAMENSFHGRSIGAVSVTGKEAYHTPFLPLLPNVKFAKFNDLDSVKALIDEKTACVILETVQGEGGVFPADPAFIKGVRELCDTFNALMIVDEIQCGMGRSGEMFAYQAYGIKPDIVTMAKALGCGVPVGCFASTEKASTMVPGDHGTTYGGNPFVCAAVKKVLSIYEEDKICEKVKALTPYLEKTLDTIKEEFPFITARRGMGFLQGLEFAPEISSAKVAMALVDAGLITIGASHNTVRFIPPLVITREDIDEMAGIVRSTLGKL